jgi:hypothetical protein
MLFCSRSQIDFIKSYGGTGQLPTFIIREPLRKANYPFDDSPWARKLTGEKIASWIDSFFDKKLEPRIRSTPGTRPTKK